MSKDARIRLAAIEVTTRYLEYLQDYGNLDSLTEEELAEKIIDNLIKHNLRIKA